MDSKAEMPNRIQGSKELHSLSKTSVLLLRDLPFVANLSKIYDDDTLNSVYDDSLKSNNEHSYGNLQEIAREYIQRNHYKKPENLDNRSDSNNVNGSKALAGGGGLKVDKSPKKYKRLDDEVIEDMQRQMHITDPLEGKSIEEITDEDLDKMITPEHKESIKNLRTFR